MAGHCQKMGSALPLHAGLIDQLQVGLVHQGGGLQSVSRRLAFQMPDGQSPHPLVEQRSQFVHGGAATAARDAGFP